MLIISFLFTSKCIFRSVLKETKTFQSFGSKGMLQSHNRKEMELDYRTQNWIQSTPIFADFMERYDLAYRLELEHFLNVLEGTATILTFNSEPSFDMKWFKN